MRRAALLAAAIIGLGFPAGLGLAVYLASGSSLAPPAATARVPTGTIGRPSTPPVTTTGTVEDISGNCDEPEHRLEAECVAGRTTEETETDETETADTTEPEATEAETNNSGKGSRNSGSGSGNSGSGSGRSGGDD